MTILPPQYAWLLNEPGPKLLVEAIKLFGIQEAVGLADNPVILEWAKEIGADYFADSTPWCGLFVGLVAHRAGKPVVKAPLWARSWATWGDPSPVPSLGDVLVFARDGGGHVALYVGEDEEAYHCLGGNQGDKVCIKRLAKPRLIAARRLYKVGVPANVRRIILKASGELSTQEG